MTTQPTTDFLAGVIEGFYGQPWTQTERLELFERMSEWGLNTYFYAPKDDLKHRALWREPYSASEANSLEDLIQGCKERHLHFVYALSPGLDIRYGSDADLDQLQRRFEQMLALGCQHFALLFDDISDRMEREDAVRWGSLASAHCYMANAIDRWVRERSADGRFLFCPTPYCGRMAERQHGGADYLPTIGRELLPHIDVLWTGPEIISQQIPVAHVRAWQGVLRRKPVIWDNLHANDYDGRRFYCGPYAGRALELRNEVRGLLVNPNNELPLNYVPLRTLSQFVRGSAMAEWDARKAYLAAMKEWLACFATVGQPISLEDLLLFGDCYYLPYEEGPEAKEFFDRARHLLTRDPMERTISDVDRLRKTALRLREFCARMSGLCDRRLFHALSRRVWDLREELDLLAGYFEKAHRTSYHSDSHLPGTYRGGMVARLQALLNQQSDGSFAPARDPDAARAAVEVEPITPPL